MNSRFGGSDVRRLLAVLVLLPGEAAPQEMHETLEAGAHATHDPALALLRVRDVRQGPEGALYIVTDEDDGELWRIVPRR